MGVGGWGASGEVVLRNDGDRIDSIQPAKLFKLGRFAVEVDIQQPTYSQGLNEFANLAQNLWIVTVDADAVDKIRNPNRNGQASALWNTHRGPEPTK